MIIIRNRRFHRATIARVPRMSARDEIDASRLRSVFLSHSPTRSVKTDRLIDRDSSRLLLLLPGKVCVASATRETRANGKQCERARVVRPDRPGIIDRRCRERKDKKGATSSACISLTEMPSSLSTSITLGAR